jgi:hypothetical protein
MVGRCLASSCQHRSINDRRGNGISAGMVGRKPPVAIRNNNCVGGTV